VGRISRNPPKRTEQNPKFNYAIIYPHTLLAIFQLDDLPKLLMASTQDKQSPLTEIFSDRKMVMYIK